jgi:ribosomal protein L29
MKKSKEDRTIQVMSALSVAMADDVLSLSEEELCQELREDKIDLAQTGAQLRCQALEQIAEFRRQRLQDASHALGSRMDRAKVVPPETAIVRQRITAMRALFLAKPGLSMAFREGRAQSDSDWMSVWDNLLELGLVREDDGAVD